MTVHELIEKLQGCKPEADVYVEQAYFGDEEQDLTTLLELHEGSMVVLQGRAP